MATRIPFKWGNAKFAWNQGSKFPNQSKYPFTWDDCALVQEIIDAGKSFPDVFKDKKKKKKFIKLLCIIEGTEYKETKEIIERQIRITDVSLVAKEVLGVDIKIDL